MEVYHSDGDSELLHYWHEPWETVNIDETMGRKDFSMKSEAEYTASPGK